MSEYDLVVVGSGFAGTAAALSFCETAAAEGRSGRVAVVEVGKDGERCGASRWTMAYLRLAPDGTFDPGWKDLVAETSKGLADMEYCRTLEDEVPATVRYLVDHGVELNYHKEPNVALEFQTDGYFAYPTGGGLAIVSALMERLRQFDNADVFWETEAIKLSLSDEGRVNGVVVRGPDGLLRTITADTVHLACGGFEGNPEMLTQYVGANAVDLPVIAPGIAHNKGAGIRMAMDIGAATAGQFDMIHAECVDTRATKPDAVIWGHNYGIVVNEQCQRFYDEGEDYLFASFELIAYEIWKNQNQKAYFITDSVVMDRFRPGWVYETTDKEPERADTIKELAEKLAVAPDELENTVNEFNAACGEGEFDPARLDGKRTHGIDPPKSNWANPIASPPFYGFPMTTHLTFTFGGIKTDTQARVLSNTGRPIPGLYAAGEMTGLFYHEYPPATSVLRSLTFGRIAGANIAKALPA